jgi:nitrate/nitrite transport system permease protein
MHASTLPSNFGGAVIAEPPHQPPHPPPHEAPAPAEASNDTRAALVAEAAVTTSRATTAAERASRLTAQEQADELKREDRRRALAKVVAPVFGFALFVLLWHVVAQTGGQLPTPAKTWDAAVVLFSDPFYSKGPNDQGIGWNVLSSLQRVGVGFGLAALVGIPLGFLIGRFVFAHQMAAPLIALLKPVSPLAWLPIGLLVFKAANPAAIWTIFICSLWPMLINTAVGVRQIPQEYLNVAKVLALSEWKVLTKILFPAVLPYLLTGVRLSIGVAWLVIVAAEMLTGGVGIGFWVWDEWNNLNVQHIIVAIFTIGLVGLLLEAALVLIAQRFEYAK